MSTTEPNADIPIRQKAQTRIIAPVSGLLRRAGVLSVMAGMLWPVQAAAIAFAISAWIDNPAPMIPTILAACVFLIAGGVKTFLDFWAGSYLFQAADETVSRERDLLLLREARAPASVGSASIAALIVQKLPMLHPWITRYQVSMVKVAVLPVLLLAVSFSLSWAVGLVLLVAGPLIPLFMALVGMAAESASRRQMVEIGTMNDLLMERLAALLDIRLLGARDRAVEDFEQRAEGVKERTMAVLRIAFLSSTVLELFAALGVAMVAVYVGFHLLGELNFGTWGEQLTVGEGIFLLLIAPEFFQPLREMAAAWHDRASGYAVIEELDELDGKERQAFVGTGQSVSPLAGALTLHVEGAVAALPGGTSRLPDMVVQQGECIALTGPSGTGKTTALLAIAGLLPLHSGRIDACGVELDESSADAWRARLALIPQKPHFPDQTLKSYLDVRGGGVPVATAVKLAQAEEVVARLPQGLGSALGETGGGVSGGEARRLMIARAIASGGDLLLADEPTADLDHETAAMVMDTLKQMKAQGKTILVATHDPALMAMMDRCIEVMP